MSQIAEERKKKAKKEAGIITANDIQAQEINERIRKAWEETNNRASYEAAESEILSESRPIVNRGLTTAEDFAGYITPGYSTVLIADDASKHARLIGEAVKHKQPGAVLGNTLKTGSDLVFGVTSLIPMIGPAINANTKKMIPYTGYDIEFTSSPAAENSSYTLTGNKSSTKFSPSQIFNGSQIHVLRTIKDAEYLEAVENAIREKYPQMSKELARQLALSIVRSLSENPKNYILNLSEVPSNNWLAETLNPTTKFYLYPDYKLSPSEYKEMLKKAFNINNDTDLMAFLNTNEQYESTKELAQKVKGAILATGELRVRPDIILAISELSGKDLEQIRSIINHEVGHMTNGGEGAVNFITEHNSALSSAVKLKPGYETLLYYLQPDEIRARALAARRLKQTTNLSYSQILDNYKNGMYRTDVNLDDLIKYYDKESLLQYLNGFLKTGGVLNYLNYIQ